VADGGMQTRLGYVLRLLKPPKGWLVIYHGVRQTASGSIYRLGLALFDLEKPEVCLQRGNSWIFGPEAPYERVGDVNDVVFPCGQTIGADGDTINLYYGAATPALRLPGAASAVFSPGWTLTGVCQRDTHFSLGGGMAGKDSRHGKMQAGIGPIGYRIFFGYGESVRVAIQ